MIKKRYEEEAERKKISDRGVKNRCCKKGKNIISQKKLKLLVIVRTTKRKNKSNGMWKRGVGTTKANEGPKTCVGWWWWWWWWWYEGRGTKPNLKGRSRKMMHVPETDREKASRLYDSHSIRSWDGVYDSESSRAGIASLNGLYVSRVNEVACNRCRVNKLRPRVEVRWCARRSV